MSEIPQNILDELWLRVESIINVALPVSQIAQAGFHTDEEERFISQEVRRLTYEPQLPNGGARERKMVERFWRLARRRDWAGATRARTAAIEWEKVDGWYYKRKPLLEKSDEKEWEWAMSIRRASHDSRMWEQKWFAEEWLKGLPERVANFRMDCMFLLYKPNGDIQRIVNMRNTLGEVRKLVALDSEAYSTPSKFRIWLNNKGGFDWSKGEREMSDLRLDVINDSAYRHVEEVVSCGWHPLSGRLDDGVEFSPLKGIWFFGDCVYGPRGELLEADDMGVHWCEEKGYLLGESARESRFLQGKPMLKPHALLAEAPWQPDTNPPEWTEEDLMRDFMRELSACLRHSVGGYDAWLMMGSVFAFAAAPEIYAYYGQFPGLWVHGEAGSGKSTVVDWLMRLCGFNLGKGLDLPKNMTPTAMLMATEMYSNLPIWGDEYRDNEVAPEKLAILRSAFMRSLQGKWTPDGLQREIKTNFIVSGESTTSDAATRGRFPHVQMAESKRSSEHLNWIRERRDWFFVFFRHLMRNRADYTRLVMNVIEEWCATITGIPDRDRLVHGIAYAGFVGMARLLRSHSASVETEFMAWMASHAGTAAIDVKSELNVNVWWEDLITCFNANELDPGFFRAEVAEMMAHPPDAPNQGAWQSYNLYFRPKSVISAVSIYLNKQHSKAALKHKDIRDQASKNPYWLGCDISKRIGQGKERSSCWGIRLDNHPLGYRPVSDEVYAAYQRNPEEGDPRMGPLFAIVHKLLGSD